ncbi:S41 family peptidase [Mucisphaera calidilacus]|uniref:Carboxy-terminal processing protease CtpB n=1 Tax=Mucisphaera calidilacus TaxID=2527982 RepID=A0A518BV18_9BACT|nr:S41 family peptidase [Mucisphaera calidilacus]QDU70833.1 Carboxy-terminal processing protease CtpB precursor [Mucisphaera calidilacus]
MPSRHSDLMRTGTALRRWALAVALLISTLASTAGAQQLAEPMSPDELSLLARHGRFNALLDALARYQKNEQAAQLIDQLEQRKTLAQQRRAARNAALDEALDRMREAATNDRTDKALTALIEAHGLSERPERLLVDEESTEVIDHAVTRAAKAVERQDWLEALELYHRLKLLYEDEGLYREESKSAAAHVRLIQLYAPERLQELARERAIARGDDVEDENEVEFDDWRDRIEDIDLRMFRSTLRQASRDHIEALSYRELMAEAVANLMRLLATDELATTFDGMNNADGRQRYTAYLADLLKTLGRDSYRMNFTDAVGLADRIINMNDMTVNLPRQVVLYELTEGVTGRLDDYSSVIWPVDVPALMRSTQGTFSGVGIQISRQENELVVVSPLERTPAQRAGIKAGDRIVRVDGRSTRTWSLTRAVDEITGPEGTNVTLTIAREGEDEDLDFKLKRARIEIESIRGWEHRTGGGWDYIIDPDARIGYVRLSQFIPKSAEHLDAAIASMEETGPVNGLILDLRFNPGGLLTSAINITDRFIDEGKIVWTVNGDEQKSAEARAKRRNTYDDFPVVVLINQGSASASEIVSGALQAHGRALIIGTRSFGKGSVQDLFALSGGKAFLKLTTQYYVIPSGRIIHRLPDATTWGIEPDLKVEMTNAEVKAALEARQAADVLREEDEIAEGDEQSIDPDEILAEGLDPQLEAALFWLRSQQLTDRLTVASRR